MRYYHDPGELQLPDHAEPLPTYGRYLGGENSSGFWWWVGWENQGGKAIITEIGVEHK